MLSMFIKKVTYPPCHCGGKAVLGHIDSTSTAIRTGAPRSSACPTLSQYHPAYQIGCCLRHQRLAHTPDRVEFIGHCASIFAPAALIFSACSIIFSSQNANPLFLPTQFPRPSQRFVPSPAVGVKSGNTRYLIAIGEITARVANTRRTH